MHWKLKPCHREGLMGCSWSMFWNRWLVPELPPFKQTGKNDKVIAKRRGHLDNQGPADNKCVLSAPNWAAREWWESLPAHSFAWELQHPPTRPSVGLGLRAEIPLPLRRLPAMPCISGASFDGPPLKYQPDWWKCQTSSVCSHDFDPGVGAHLVHHCLSVLWMLRTKCLVVSQLS